MATTPATSAFGDWDFSNYHIQREVTGGHFVSAESTLVAAGAPELAGSAETAGKAPSSTEVYPIGLLEQAALQQSKQLQRIFEIGSSRSYFVPGRVIGSLSLGRTFFFGPSLLRALYAYYASGSDFGDADLNKTVELPDGTIAIDPHARLVSTPKDLKSLRRAPGADSLFIDLASDLFAQPIGMAIYFKDIRHNDVGALYLENAYVQGHQMTISSGSVLIMEGASLQYDMLRPIEMIT
jgi:hypothetical protein